MYFRLLLRYNFPVAVEFTCCILAKRNMIIRSSQTAYAVPPFFNIVGALVRQEDGADFM